MTELAWTTAQSGATIEGNIDAQTNVQQAQINASHAQLEPAQAGLVFAKQMKVLGWGIRRISEELGCSHMTVRRYIATGGYVPYRGCFAGQDLPIKKTLLATEQERADVKAARTFWISRRLPFMRMTPHRLVKPQPTRK